MNHQLRLSAVSPQYYYFSCRHCVETARVSKFILRAAIAGTTPWPFWANKISPCMRRTSGKW